MRVTDRLFKVGCYLEQVREKSRKSVEWNSSTSVIHGTIRTRSSASPIFTIYVLISPDRE